MKIRHGGGSRTDAFGPFLENVGCGTFSGGKNPRAVFPNKQFIPPLAWHDNRLRPDFVL